MADKNLIIPENLDLKSFVYGMQLSMRICRNISEDIREKTKKDQANDADNCAGVIRLLQVEIDSGRFKFEGFTPQEVEEVERIF